MELTQKVDGKYERDITGRKFGRLTAIEPAEERKGRTFWRCRCDCGNTCTVLYWNLVRNHTRSCGCIKSPDLTGKRFGHLTVLGRSGRTGPRGSRRSPLWECQCDCGEITYKASDSLNEDRQSTCHLCAARNAMEVARKAAGYMGGTQVSRIKDMKLTAANSSGVRGVYFDKKSNRWRARLRFRGKIMSFGSYERFEDAVAARRAAEKEYFGAFLEENGM